MVPAVLLFLLGFAALTPVVTNLLMTTRPLDEGLRERVLATCQEQGLRIRDVRLLDSQGGRVGNAAISGVLPDLRYVFLTDHLVEILDGEELDAVLAHEIGHGKGHHLLLKLAATLGALGLMATAFVFGGERLVTALSGTAGLLVAVLGLPVVLVLVLLLAQGVVGVALEKRADDHAVQVVGAGPLASALEKIAEANGTKRRTGWLWNVLQQHPGIEQRLHRLREHSPQRA